MQGTVEKAQQELKRRYVPPCYRGCASTAARIDLWYERASRTVGIAQGLEQAATESLEALEEVLHSQSWDHRTATKVYSDKLREMELEPEVESNMTYFDDYCNKGPKWQKSQRLEQVESAQGRLEAWILKIQRQEREDQFKMTKEKKKTLRIKRRELEAIDSSNINA